MKKIKQIGILLSLVAITILAINYIFYEPTEINAFIASKIYKDGVSNPSFDDDIFYKCVVDAYNQQNDTNIAYTESLTDEQLSTITKLSCFADGVVSTQGLEKLISLERLDLHYNSFSSLDVSNNNKLTYLRASFNFKLENINLDKATELTTLILDDTNLTELNIESCDKLEHLSIDGSKLTDIDLTDKKNLTYLNLAENNLTQLNVDTNTKLETLVVYGNQISNLNVNNNLELDKLYVGVDEKTGATYKGGYGNLLKSLNLTNNTKLTELSAANNQLADLDVANNKELVQLIAFNNSISNINLDNNIKLEILSLGFDYGCGSGSGGLGCPRDYGNNLSELDISNNVNLKELYVSNNNLSSIDLSNNKNIEILQLGNNKLKSLDVSSCLNLNQLVVSENNLSELDLRDNNAITILYAQKNEISDLLISNLNKLNYLNASNNSLLDLDLSGNTLLTQAFLESNVLETINIKDCSELSELELNYNNLSSIDLSNAPYLKKLFVQNNPIISLDLSKNKKLEYFNVSSDHLRGETVYIYNGDKIEVSSQIKVPNDLVWETITWSSKNNDIAMVDSNARVTTLKSGVVDIVGSSIMNLKNGWWNSNEGSVKSKYTTTSTINVVEITSDKYQINNEENYIYVRLDDNADIIKENINISDEEIDINADLDNNKLQVKHNEDILKEFKIIKLNSAEYDLNKEYIYTGTAEFDLTKVNVINGTKEVKDNKLQVKYNELLLQEYDIVTISSEIYDLSNEYILSGGHTNLEKINIVNGNAVIEDNMIKIKYNDEVLQTYYESSFDNQKFYNCVIDKYNKLYKIDLPYKKHLLDEQLLVIKELNCSNYGVDDSNKISSVKGLEKLTSLVVLKMTDNLLTEIDLSKNVELEELYLTNNKLSALDVSKNVKLQKLYIGGRSYNSTVVVETTNGNNITEINLKNNILLKSLSVRNNPLTNLDISKNTALEWISIQETKISNLNVSNNINLKTLDISDNDFTYIDISNNYLLEALVATKNQLTELNVSQNTKLKYLWVNHNQLTSLDVSQNTALTSLDASSNPYKEIRHVYKGNILQTENQVKLPEQLNWSNPTWTTKDNSMATVDSNGLVTTLKMGIVDLIGTVSGKYTTTSTINIVEITSDKYQINEKENYIYVGLDDDIDTIKENINTSHEEIDINVDLDNNNLQVKYNDDILKEFKIIKLNSAEYDLSKEYIYTGINQLDETKVNIVNANKEVKENKLLIKYKDVLLQEYALIRFNTDRKIINKYMYVNNLTDEEILSKINIVNCNKEIGNNKLTIKYNEMILDEYNLIRVSYGTLSILDENKIYVGNRTTEDIVRNIKVTGDILVSKDKIEISINNQTIEEIKLLSLDLGNLKESSKMIVISNYISHNDFTSNITLSEGLNYKILNGSNEVTNGSIFEGMKLKIYYGDIEVDSFDITEEYLYFDGQLDIDTNNKYLSNIEVGAKVNSILDMIDTSGAVTIANNKNEVITGNNLIGTGSKVSIKLNSRTIEYLIVIRGDITGDGELKLADVMKIANYTYKDKNSLNGVYANAADYDNNGKYNLQDIMKPANKLYGK